MMSQVECAPHKYGSPPAKRTFASMFGNRNTLNEYEDDPVMRIYGMKCAKMSSNTSGNMDPNESQSLVVFGREDLMLLAQHEHKLKELFSTYHKLMASPKHNFFHTNHYKAIMTKKDTEFFRLCEKCLNTLEMWKKTACAVIELNRADIQDNRLHEKFPSDLWQVGRCEKLLEKFISDIETSKIGNDVIEIL